MDGHRLQFAPLISHMSADWPFSNHASYSTAGSPLRPLLQESRHVCGVSGPSEVETLAEAASQFRQPFGLGDALDSFGDCPHAKLLGDIDQRFDDDPAGGVGKEAVDETLVDLDDVHRKAEKMGQRGEAGAEVVEGDKHPLVSQARHSSRDIVVRAVHENGFGHLQDQMLQRNLFGIEGGADDLIEIAVSKIGHREVHANMLEGNAVVEPRANVGGDLRQHLSGQTISDVGIGEGIRELAGGRDAAILGPQPRQSFETNDLLRIEPHDGLIVSDEPVLGEGEGDLANGFNSSHGAGSKSRLKCNVTAPVGLLCMLESEIGVLMQMVGAVPIRTADDAANGHLRGDRVVATSKRKAHGVKDA
ncbi:MAG TPA: hypothetical protein VIN77_08915 [Aurantimonas sp.]